MDSPDLTEALDMLCKFRLFWNYMYQDMILNFINLKQAHTNAI